MHWGIGDTHHIDSWASYASVIDILVGEALYGITEMAQHFVFDLTCDVIGEAEVNETWFPSTNLPEIYNSGGNLQIGPVVSEIRREIAPQ